MNERFRASLSVNVIIISIIISIIVSFYLSFLQKHWMTKKKHHHSPKFGWND